ncbi:MAG: GNAT family N-acetyltransferase [Deltaproteobacteria bacterium]|nr:GNAT family N-acetyltransferase [Deltaproteobacteria bacterium]
MYTINDYKDKIIDIEKLISLIEPGNKIYLTSGSAIPAKAVNEILSSEDLYDYDLEIIQLFTLGDFFTRDTGSNQKYRLNTFKTGESASGHSNLGNRDFIPSNLVEIPSIFSSGAIEVDVAIITVSPPDERGYMSLGVAIDVAKLAIKNASIVILEVNPNMPVTYGDTTVHIDQVDHVIEGDVPLIERKSASFGPMLDRIGWHISNLIEDGSTLVLHAGRIFDAVAHHARYKKKLCVFTNVVSDWVIDLIESGSISRDREREKGGLVTTSYCFGTKQLYDYVDRNQTFGFYPASRLADPRRIRRISNLVSIMNIEKIDITAGTVSFHKGDDLLSGFESKFHFAVGAAATRNGKVIFAVRSIDRKGKSNIVIYHNQDNNRLRSTLGIARYVVTEHGVANMFGKSIRERVLAMIDIAHPDHKEELLRQAKEFGYVYPDQIYSIENAANYPIELETLKTFKDGLDLKIRPIKPTDEDMMRRLFYKFSD